MRCVKPFVAGEVAYGCGQCMPCRLNRRRVWTHRIMLESLLQKDNAFATLTYSEENVPVNGEVVPQHLSAWVKRLRKAIEPRRIRFFGVGEYGDLSGRPHYHAALFGYPSCSVVVRAGGQCECLACSVVRKTWGFGHIFLGNLEKRSAQYIAGYVTKKMTSRDDLRLNGRHPEFARMSLRPGIGASAMWDVASVMLQYRSEATDVVKALRHGKATLPLGRYLTKKLRSMVGRDEKAPQEVVEELAAKVRLVRAFAWDNERSVSSVFAEVNQPYSDQMEGRLTLRGRSL